MEPNYIPIRKKMTFNINGLNPLSIYGRIWRGLIDKIILYFLFIFALIMILGPYEFYKMGYAVSVCALPPGRYHYLSQDTLNVSGLCVAVFLIIDFLYYLVSDYNGRTIAKYFSRRKIRLINFDGSKLSFAACLKRQVIFAIVVFITWLISYVYDYAYCWAILANILCFYAPLFYTVNNQSMLDVLSGTIVVKEQVSNRFQEKQVLEEASWKETGSIVRPNSIYIGNENKSKKGMNIFLWLFKLINWKLNKIVKKIKMIFSKLLLGLESVLKNKKYFPFNQGINRIIVVFWLGSSLFVEVMNWKYKSGRFIVKNINIESICNNGIDHYFVGLIPFILLPFIYLVFLWIYRGFQESKNV